MPSDNCVIPEFLSADPAPDVPHNWQRAAGFVPIFIAQAESKHFVKDDFEQLAEYAPVKPIGVIIIANVNIFLNLFIFSLSVIVSKKRFLEK
jgi:hypothetical protein